MTVPTVACTNCGKPFTTDDLRGTNCRYCGTLLAHHARAQQQVAVVNAMMVDRNGNGIPDAFEGVVANAQANAMNQAFGMNPYGPQVVSSVVVSHNAGHPMHMHAAHMHAANQVAHVSRAMSKVVMTIVIVVVLMIALSMAIGMATFFMAR